MYNTSSNVVFKRGDGYYLSYNPSPQNILDALLSKPENLGRPETAIAVEDSSAITSYRFYILYGDHRQTLSKMDTIEQFISYFTENIHLVADSSDGRPTANA